MKKFLVSLLLIVMSFTILSCDANKYLIPDIIGMEINEAKLLIAGEVKTEITYESTNQHLPNLVLGFHDGLEVNDKMNKNKTLNLIVSQAPKGSFTHSEEIEYVYDLGFVTGPDSENFDLLRETGIGSTDLGIPVTIDDKIVYLYGDTFSGTENMSGLWNSNVMVEFTDKDFSDGITFSRVISNDRGFALAFAQGLHHKSETDEESQNPSREVTKIPTGGIQVGENVYFFYMSVRYWGSHGAWGVSYNQVVKSDTSLSSFSEVDGLRWTEELASNFGQIFPFENPDVLVTTPIRKITPEEAENPDIVKVVFTLNGKALYFSRSPIPCPRENHESEFYGHIGLYAFRMNALRQFVALQPGRLERTEKLEQLRLLENEIPVHVLIIKHRSIGVDRPEDIEKVSKILKKERE